MEINEGYVIRRTILFDNKCGFVIGEDPKAPNPFVTWQFNERDGRRGYFWGHYHNTPEQAEADFQERAERLSAALPCEGGGAINGKKGCSVHRGSACGKR